MLPAISIRQPWPYAIVHLGKDVENRSKPWRYRGPIAIHSSKMRLCKDGTPTMFQTDEVLEAIHAIDRMLAVLQVRKPKVTWERLIEQSGSIVAVARLVDCVTESDSPWFVGPHGLVLRDVRPTPIIQCRGHQGMWAVPPEIEQRLRREGLV